MDNLQPLGIRYGFGPVTVADFPVRSVLPELILVLLLHILDTFAKFWRRFA